jgi:hypothetical protein
VRATHSAVTYSLFTGYIMSYRVTGVARGSVPTCTFECTDLMGVLSELQPINVTVTSRLTSAAYTAVAAAAGLAGADYNFPTGAQTLPVHWVHSANALDALSWVQASEMGGELFVDGAGVIQGEPRTARRLVTGLDDTWGDGTAIFPREAAVTIENSQVITSAEVQAQILTTDEAEAIILAWTRGMDSPTPDSVAIVAGDTYEATFPAVGPVASIVTPVATTDYLANTAIGGTGTDMTASLTVTATLLGAAVTVALKNTHAATTLYVTKLQVRGTGYMFITGERPTFRASHSISTDKTQRSVQAVVPYADDIQSSSALRDYALHLLYSNRLGVPVLTVTLDASSDVKKVALLALELGDLVKYKDTLLTTEGTYSDEWYYVDRIRHMLPPNGALDTFRSTVTLVPSWLWRQLDSLVFDDFTRANAVGDLGTASSARNVAWTGDGNMDITSNTARANSDTLQMPTLALTAGNTDHAVQVSLAAIGAGDEVGVVFRYVDANNQYRAYLDKGSNEVILEKNVAGAMTELSSPAYTVGTTAELLVFCQSTRIRVYVDRVLYIDTTDSALTTGVSVGLFTRNANATTTFDNFLGEGL